MHRVREHRRKVVIRARMRAGAAPVDVCIRDLSSRGLMLQTGAPPPRGSYVEIVGASLTIVGRVIWAKERRFGVRTNDPIDVPAVLFGIQPPSGQRPPAPAQRRQCSANARPHTASSRMLATAMQFAMVGAFAALLVVVLAGTAYETLRRPLEHIEARLARGK